MKYICIIIIVLLLSSCLEKEYHRELRKNNNIVSVMKVKKIQYLNNNNDNLKNIIDNYKLDFVLLNIDSTYKNLYCLYYIEFEKPILKNEREFCFIDTINKYKVGDKFPK